jgi:hypothetical protein
MELINSTRMVAGYTMGLEPTGRELLVVVVKGTFSIPTEPGAALKLQHEQVPLVMSDEFFGEPGVSAPRYEVDFAPRKQRCDILLNGSAHAPDGRPTNRVTVGLKVGAWSKAFSVVGNRTWYKAAGVHATSPEPFMIMPISYDRAFGGVDLRHDNPAKHAAYRANPCGRGFHEHLNGDWLQGSPLPNTEELGKPVSKPDGSYRPMSFGAVGRHWEPRCNFAGTYDEQWQAQVFPFLPGDFDEQYYQCASIDQQLPGLVGEQTVTLLNLTPEGRCVFVLPHFRAPVCILTKKGVSEEYQPTPDTVLIEPDYARVMLSWRVTRPLRSNLFEIAQVIVGKRERAFPIPVVVEPMPERP